MTLEEAKEILMNATEEDIQRMSDQHVEFIMKAAKETKRMVDNE